MDERMRDAKNDAFYAWLKTSERMSYVWSRVTREYYRATVDGRVWIESKDPQEVLERSAGKDAVFEKITYCEVTDGWHPWNAAGSANSAESNEGDG